jgi:hypothetical protein
MLGVTSVAGAAPVDWARLAAQAVDWARVVVEPIESAVEISRAPDPAAAMRSHRRTATTDLAPVRRAPAAGRVQGSAEEAAAVAVEGDDDERCSHQAKPAHGISMRENHAGRCADGR